MAPFRTILATSLLALGTSACAMISGTPSTRIAMPGHLEPIHAASITNDLAVFWVSSNGCTDKDDLTPVVDHAGHNSVITLRRIDEDRCDRPMADGVELQWSFEELGLTPGSRVSVNNPYQLPPTT